MLNEKWLYLLNGSLNNFIDEFSNYTLARPSLIVNLKELDPLNKFYLDNQPDSNLLPSFSGIGIFDNLFLELELITNVKSKVRAGWF